MFGPFVKKNWFSGFYCILGKFLKKLTKNWITLLRKLVSEGCKESKSCFAIRNKDVLRTRPMYWWGFWSNPTSVRSYTSNPTYHRLPNCWHTPGLPHESVKKWDLQLSSVKRVSHMPNTSSCRWAFMSHKDNTEQGAGRRDRYRMFQRLREKA